MELGDWSDTVRFNEKELKLLKYWEQKPFSSTRARAGLAAFLKELIVLVIAA